MDTKRSSSADATCRRKHEQADWICRSCQHLNLFRRDSCQRCGEPRPRERDGNYRSFGGRSGVGSGSPFGFSTGPDIRPGDWYCTVGNCGVHNFASRSRCFKCGIFKEDSSSGNFDSGMYRTRGFGFGFGGGGGGGWGGSSRSGWGSGAWICTRSGCNAHNFASRMECFKCNAPRDSADRGTVLRSPVLCGANRRRSGLAPIIENFHFTKLVE